MLNVDRFWVSKFSSGSNAVNRMRAIYNTDMPSVEDVDGAQIKSTLVISLLQKAGLMSEENFSIITNACHLYIVMLKT